MRKRSQKKEKSDRWVVHHKQSPGCVCLRLKVKPVLSVAVMLAVACSAVVAATAVQASQPGGRRRQSDVARIVSVAGVVQPSPGGLGLKSANGRNARAGRDLFSYMGLKGLSPEP